LFGAGLRVTGSGVSRFAYWVRAIDEDDFVPSSEPLHLKILPVTPLRQNCSVLYDAPGGVGVVTDPGGNVESILRFIEAEGLRIDAILLTHGHGDHVGGADELREVLRARQGDEVAVIGPDRRDAFLLADARGQAERLGIMGARDVQPDRYVEDGDVLTVMGREMLVRHVPGHTPGHVVFIDPAARLALVGDTLFRGVIGRTDFSYGDHAALVDGIRAALMVLPDDVAVLPGHGMPTTIGAERDGNPYI